MNAVEKFTGSGDQLENACEKNKKQNGKSKNLQKVRKLEAGFQGWRRLIVRIVRKFLIDWKA